MKKIVSLFFIMILLNGCAESLALLGPITTASAGGGKVAQSAVSSAVNYAVKKQTGQSPAQHALNYVKKHNPENKKEKCIKFIDSTNSETCAVIKKNISEGTKKIVKIKKNILDKSKIENLAKKSTIYNRR